MGQSTIYVKMLSLQKKNRATFFLWENMFYTTNKYSALIRNAFTGVHILQAYSQFNDVIATIHGSFTHSGLSKILSVKFLLVKLSLAKSLMWAMIGSFIFLLCCYLLSPWLETPSLNFMIKETYIHQIRLPPPFTISKNDDATMLMNQFQHCLASRDPPSFTHCKYRVHTHCSHSYLASVRDTWDTQRPFHMKFCVNNDHFAYWWGTFYPDIQP